MGIKYKVDEKFFNVWSRKMAYVLGFLFADGSLEDAPYLRGKYIRFVSINREIILKIKKAISSKHTIYEIKPATEKQHRKYLLRIGSNKIYKDLSKFGLSPNKSLTMKLPKIPKKYFADFVRGYFDGDGCVFVEFGRGRKHQKIFKGLKTIFTSGSEAFLEALSNSLLKACRLSKKSVYISRRAFQLRYGTADSVKLFYWMYKKLKGQVYLRRKLKEFERFFIIRPTWRNKKIDNIFGSVAKW